ncbi:MAG TPA: hypothetical protein VN706_01465 [Gemmatimonadaceae bacterium]|nr:hypothetical protein [Gemmatimonadaceae bacterium]
MRFVAAAVVLAGCASSAPKTFGAYHDLAPAVAPTQGERLPQHLTVQLNRPANVAVFLVVPGRGSQLLFPADSNQSGFMDAGSHLVETYYARRAPTDTSRLIRQPATRPMNPPGGRGFPQRGRGDSTIAFGGAARGFLLIYASQEPLPYNILSTKVSGLSLPIEDQDALNTVTKLVRETTHTTGPWAAYATDFPK